MFFYSGCSFTPDVCAVVTHLLLQLELLATRIKADAEAKALLRIVNRLTAEKEYTVKTLVQRCAAAAPLPFALHAC